MSLFAARVETASLTLAPCYFITVTYKEGSRGRGSVDYVQRDWKALWRRLRRSGELSEAKWLRVMEVTRKMMPHHHVMMGPVEGKGRCYGNSFYIRNYRRQFDSCECLSHRLGRHWKEVTGDSYIVHVVPVMAGAGAGRYMAKYLGKTFGAESRLAAVGTTRRWSTSRGFPGLRYGLKNKDWSLIIHIPGHQGAVEAGNPDLLERSGNDIVTAVMERRKRNYRNLRSVKYDV